MLLGKDEQNNDDMFFYNYGPVMAVSVATEHNFEGATCFTPTERSNNLLEHIDLQQLDSGDYNSPSNVKFKPDGASRARVDTPLATPCTRPAGDGRTSRITAPQVALRRVRKLFSEAARQTGATRPPPSVREGFLVRPSGDTLPEKNPIHRPHHRWLLHAMRKTLC